MKPSKKIAVVLAGALAAAGVAVIAAPSAQALPTTPLALFCNVTGISTSAANWAASHTVTLNGNSAAGQNFNAGDPITAVYTYTNGPNSAAPTNGATAFATLQVFNNTTNTVVQTLTTATDGPYGSLPSGPFPGATLTAPSFNAPAAGNYSVRILNTRFVSNIFGIDVDCNAQSGWVSQGGLNQTNNPVAYGATQFNSLGPAFTKTSVSGQSVTTHGRPGEVVTVSGTLFGANASIPTTGVTVGGIDATASTLSVTGGALSGTFTIPAVASGDRTITITNGSATANSVITILASPAASQNTTNVGGGGNIVITLTTNTWDPTQPVTATLGANVATVNADTAGGGTISLTVAAGTANGPIVLTQPVGLTFTLGITTVLNDKCVAWEDGNIGSQDGNPGCNVKQTLEITITAGDLTQRHFVRQVTATNQNAVGPGSTVAPVNNAGTGVGQPTPNQNRGSQNIDLGGIQTPLVPKNVFGVMNDITVTDTRGGALGWTLSATMTTITAGPGKSINSNALAVSTTCGTATAANAWDFDALSKQVIAGYVDPWDARNDGTVAIPATTAGLFPVASLTAFANNNGTPAIKLCEKNMQLNNYGTSGGVFNVTGNLRLTVPAFQATGTYNGVMTVTLA